MKKRLYDFFFSKIKDNFIFWLVLAKKGLANKPPRNYPLSDDSSFANVKYIVPSFKKNKVQILLLSIVLIFLTLLTFPQPLLIKYLFNDALLKKNISQAITIFIALSSIYILLFILNQIYQFWHTIISRRITEDLQSKIVDTAFNLPLDIFSKSQTGYLFSRLTNEVSEINDLFLGLLPHSLIQMIRLTGGLFFILLLKWELALIIISTFPVPVFLSIMYSKKAYNLKLLQNESMCEYSGSLTEHISNIQLIKMAGEEEKSISELKVKINRITQFINEYAATERLFLFLSGTFPGLARFLTLLIGTFLVIKSKWDIGSLVAFYLYISFVYGAINQLIFVYIRSSNIKASIDRYATIFKIIPDINFNQGQEINNLGGEIEFKNVSFYYDQSLPILEDVNLKIKRGEKWFVVGKNGVGKTTLFYLILQFYRPVKGSIYFDKKPADLLNPKSIRKRIGFISQKNFLLSGTVKSNILFGIQEKEYTNEKILKIAEEVGLHQFLNSLPNGLETLIKEDGKNLSEGQKRKIAILRAMICKPDILILDEAETFLDLTSSIRVNKSISAIQEGKTTLTISHNPYEIKDMDKVIFISENKSLIQDNHKNLLDNNLEYKSIFQG